MPSKDFIPTKMYAKQIFWLHYPFVVSSFDQMKFFIPKHIRPLLYFDPNKLLEIDLLDLLSILI